MIWPISEARAEILLKFRLLFGQWSFKKNCFWDFPTFRKSGENWWSFSYCTLVCIEAVFFLQKKTNIVYGAKLILRSFATFFVLTIIWSGAKKRFCFTGCRSVWNQTGITGLLNLTTYTNVFGKKNASFKKKKKFSSPNLWILKNPWLRLLKAVSSTLPLVSGKRSGSSLIRTVKWQRWYVSQYIY